MLITGAIWARAAWGKWWVWDEPTLVSFLIVFLLYARYYPLRFAIEDRERQARYASVFAITAGAFVPLNFIAVRLAESLVHPRVLRDQRGRPARTMLLTFLVCLAGMALLCRDAGAASSSRRSRLGRGSRACAARSRATRSRPAARGSRRSPRGDGVRLMPALPLDEAGKYVAGAYVVFVALLLIYVAIMAASSTRIERELAELAELAEQRERQPSPSRGDGRAGGVMAELLALGVSHKTAPLELRERMALTEGRAVGRAAASWSSAPEIPRRRRSRPATAPSSTSRRRPGRAPRRGARLLAREAEMQPDRAGRHLYSLRGAARPSSSPGHRAGSTR